MASAQRRKRPGPRHRTITVLIADDHPVVRRGLKQILADTPDIAVAGEAATGAEVLDRIRRHEYDVICLDLTMPGGSGVEVLQTLRRDRPELPVLVLSMHPEEQYAVRVLRAGAAGYLTKDGAPEELVAAIRKVHAGGRYVSSGFAEKLFLGLDNPATWLPHERLSDREYQVLCLLATGKRPKQIAQELHLSVKTISTFRARLLRKMGMKSTADLMRYAIQHRLPE